MLYAFDENAFFVCLAILSVFLIVVTIKKRSFSYSLFFFIFGIYMLNVIRLVIFPIFIHDPATLGQLGLWLNINLIPFNFGAHCAEHAPCLRQIRDNILLTIPFGFGIRFIAPLKARDFIWLPFAVGFGLEISQFVVSLGSFHSLDINDVILNAAGVAIGYGCFRVFGWIYRNVLNQLKINPRWVFGYIDQVVK
jgi:glycopeptide antibiotics resistance protein